MNDGEHEQETDDVHLLAQDPFQHALHVIGRQAAQKARGDEIPARLPQPAKKPHATHPVPAEPDEHRDKRRDAALGPDEQVDGFNDARVVQFTADDLTRVVLVGVLGIHLEAPVVDAHAAQRLVLDHFQCTVGQFHPRVAGGLRRGDETLDDAREDGEQPEKRNQRDRQEAPERAHDVPPVQKADQQCDAVAEGHHGERPARIGPESRNHVADERHEADLAEQGSRAVHQVMREEERPEQVKRHRHAVPMGEDPAGLVVCRKMLRHDGREIDEHDEAKPPHERLDVVGRLQVAKDGEVDDEYRHHLPKLEPGYQAVVSRREARQAEEEINRIDAEPALRQQAPDFLPRDQREQKCQREQVDQAHLHAPRRTQVFLVRKEVDGRRLVHAQRREHAPDHVPRPPQVKPQERRQGRHAKGGEGEDDVLHVSC